MENISIAQMEQALTEIGLNFPEKIKYAISGNIVERSSIEMGVAYYGNPEYGTHGFSMLGMIKSIMSGEIMIA